MLKGQIITNETIDTENLLFSEQLEKFQLKFQERCGL